MWSMTLRIVAALLAVAVGMSYALPDGKLRSLSFVAIPILIVAFIEIRRKAGKVPDPEDPPWNG